MSHLVDTVAVKEKRNKREGSSSHIAHLRRMQEMSGLNACGKKIVGEVQKKKVIEDMSAIKSKHSQADVLAFHMA